MSPRTGGVAAWTGDEAVFIGGETKDLCPPNADCIKAPEYARDGAAYNPESRTWRAIPDAPFPIGGYTPRAVVDSSLIIVDDDGAWHALTENRWRSLPSPPSPILLSSAAVNAWDGRVAAIGDDRRIQVLDVAEEKWSVLRPSPHRPRIDVRHALPTASGIVVIGVDPNVPDDGTVPSFLVAEVHAKGEWRRLERSDMVSGYVWHWTGERLVAPDLQCVDGGEVNGYGRCVPEGGRLDPESGQWSRLPHLPELGASGWSIGAADGPRMLAWGYLYDDREGTWTKIERPAGAPSQQVASTWADGTVIAFGGVDWRGGSSPDLSNRAWAWTP
ncbi:MAG: hypothetical protein ACRDOT_09465 [Aeromicrobium sp.]